MTYYDQTFFVASVPMWVQLLHWYSQVVSHPSANQARSCLAFPTTLYIKMVNINFNTCNTFDSFEKPIIYSWDICCHISTTSGCMCGWFSTFSPNGTVQKYGWPLMTRCLPSQVKVTGCRDSEISIETLTEWLLSPPPSLWAMTGLRTKPGLVVMSSWGNLERRLDGKRKQQRESQNFFLAQ